MHGDKVDMRLVDAEEAGMGADDWHCSENALGFILMLCFFR